MAGKSFHARSRNLYRCGRPLTYTDRYREKVSNYARAFDPTSGGKVMSIFGSIMGAIFGHSSAQASASPTAAPAAPPAQTVDVAAIVDKAAAATGEKLAWRTSIVDLMKALNLDSSIGARKQLAKELNYTGDTNDSATMNVWLHKQIMAKLAANGGKLPADIKA
jgi:hypothetical protein